MRPYILPALFLGLLLLFASACKEPCDDVTCENGGNCIEGVCECPAGFSGEFCETFEANQIIGAYNVDYGSCFTVSPNHEVIISQQVNQSNTFDLFNLGDYACPDGTLRLSFTLNVNEVTLPRQTVDCGVISYVFEGSGQFVDGVLTLNFTNTYDAGGFEQVDNCVASLTLKN